MDKIRVVAYVDSDMTHDADDVPLHEAGSTLLVPALTDAEGGYAAELGDQWSPLDAVYGLESGTERPRMWAMFDREGTTEEKVGALAEYRGA